MFIRSDTYCYNIGTIDSILLLGLHRSDLKPVWSDELVSAIFAFGFGS